MEQLYTEARLQFQRGDTAQAVLQARAALRKAGTYPAVNWKFRTLLAEAALRDDKPEQAIQILGDGPPSNLSFDVRWRYALAHSSANCKLHNDSAADHDLQDAVRLAGLNPTLLDEVALFRGRCQLTRGQIKDAEKSFATAAQAGNPDQFTRLYALMGLGVCARLSHEYESALDRYAQVEDLSHKLSASFFEEGALGNQGFFYAELGDFQRGLEKSQAAEKLAGKLGIAEHQQKWLLDIGRAYDNTGRSGLAEEYFRRALSLARSTRSDDIAGIALNNLTLLTLLKGDLKQAIDFHAEAAKLNLQGDSAADFRFDEACIAASSHDEVKAEQLLLDLLPVVRNDARRTWMVEAELARVYAAQGKPLWADGWFQKSINTMVEEAARRKNVEFRIAMLGNLPIFDDYIAFLFQQNRPERALQVAQLARARTLTEQLGFKPAKDDAANWVNKIKSMLRDRRSVLLAYYEAEHETYAWILTANKLEMKALGINQNDLETLADTYREEIDQHTAIDSSPAEKKLYHILIAPMAALIPHNAHVILVGDSALYRINFEALVLDAGHPHYWIEDAEIENASSIDLLLAEKRVSRHGTGALIIGAPKQVSPQYPLLPHAHEEVDSVKDQFPPAQRKVFEDAAATPDAYASSQPSRFKYIEFATHSDASSSDPMQSAIILANAPGGSFKLFARDILQTKHRLNAELVSISGCYSIGKFRTSAEGLLGLQWAFMRAGAHQVVAGLWDVDDKSSPQLMGGLYSGIVHGQSAAAALRLAKLKMIHATQSPPPPYYWAALQLYTGL